MSRLPLIGVTACTQQTGSHACHIRGDQHVRAEAIAAKGLPSIPPTLTAPVYPPDTLSVLDGLRFSDALSSVDSTHCGGPGKTSSTVHDPARDRSTLTLAPAAVAGVQRLGIFCEFQQIRGRQETNVAFGGGLQHKVHEAEAFMDHPEPPYPSVARQYAARYPVHVAPGEVLPGLALSQDIRVNSFHAQGIERLAPGLRVKASAPEGLIEASPVASGAAFASADGFARCAQWHSEWQGTHHSDYLVIFQAFGDACRTRSARHAVHASR